MNLITQKSESLNYTSNFIDFSNRNTTLQTHKKINHFKLRTSIICYYSIYRTFISKVFELKEIYVLKWEF